MGQGLLSNGVSPFSAAPESHGNKAAVTEFRSDGSYRKAAKQAPRWRPTVRSSPSIFDSMGVRTLPCCGALLEVLSRPAPNRLGAVQVRHERYPLARKAGHSESQPQQESRVIWQGASVPG